MEKTREQILEIRANKLAESVVNTERYYFDLIYDLKESLYKLVSLVEAIDVKNYKILANDISGENWFDVRTNVLKKIKEQECL